MYARRIGWSIGLASIMAACAAGCGADIESFLFDRLRIGEPGQSVRIDRDLVYAERASGPLNFDLFRLESGGDAMPFVICVHGGRWSRGDRQDMEDIAWDLASRGFAAATIDIRLVTDTVKHPSPAVDVMDAVDFFRANATAYGLDPDRIALLGASSGAHLALLAGLPGDLSQVDPNRPAGAASAVAAVVNFAGPTDFTIDPASALPWQVLAVAELLGFTVDQLLAQDGTLPLGRAASPVSYVRADGPPVMTIHGTVDVVVPVSQAHLLRDALSAAGQDQTYLELAWYGHPDGSDWSALPGQLYIRPAVLRFLREHL